MASWIRNSVAFALCLATTGLSNAWAREYCVRLEYKGRVQLLDGRLRLLIHPGSRSERALPIAVGAAERALPYAGVTSRGELVLKPGGFGRERIVSITRIDHAAPNPLNPKEDSYLRRPREVPCP